MNSENGLYWVYSNLTSDEIVNKLENIKNKGKFRQILKHIYPDFFFNQLPLEKLKDYGASTLPYPVVLKPAVGFFSLGVYVINDEKEWNDTVHIIDQEMEKAKSKFPESVVNVEDFVIEAYINGTEYAVDDYYDSNGDPVILNIFTHRFASSEDVSDRIYYTSKEMIETYKTPFETFFA